MMNLIATILNQVEIMTLLVKTTTKNLSHQRRMSYLLKKKMSDTITM